MSLAIIAGVLLAGTWLMRRTRRAARPHPGRARRGALLSVVLILVAQAMVGIPASAQGLGCKEPPNPERPGSGMVGAIDPAPAGVGTANSPYDEVGYAGLVWHTYDLGCGPQSVINPDATVDTWVGNELFNIGKNIVGATNQLHYALLSGDLMKPLDGAIATGTVALYDSLFAPWFGLVAVVLAVLLFRYIWQGDMATIGKRTTWALAGLWFASATYLTPLVYTHALDDVVITGTSAVQAGFLREVGVDERDALPTLLHDQVVYRNWLRGEFSTPDSPQAKELGRDLLRAQAWTKEEVLRGEDAGSAEEKKQQFRDVAAKMGGAYGYLQGVDGSRTGAGFLATVQGLAFASFQLLAKAAILLAQVLLRVLILAGPVIGLVALLYHQLLRGIGRVAGAAMLNVVVISAMAGVHTLVLTWIFNPANGFGVLTQILLAGLVTVVFFMIGKPVRRMGQMVELSVGSVGGAVPRAPSSLFSRFRGRRMPQDTPQGDFWDQVRGSDPDAEYVAGQGEKRTHRPEAEHPGPSPVSVRAQRLDRDGYQRSLVTGGAIAEGAGGLSAPDRGDPQRPGTRALPEARSTSRIVDTAPPANAAWDVREDDPLVIPSRTDNSPEYADINTWRRSDQEVVAGKPADVIYRPSRGLEVSDDGWRA